MPLKTRCVLDCGLTALAVAAAAAAVFYAGAQLLGLVYAPFAVVDWLARATPGAALTFALDGLIGVLQALSVSDLSTGAKTAEMLSGICLVTLGLTITGSLLLARSKSTARGSWRRGGVAGIAAGALLAAVIARMGAPQAALSSAWTIAVLTTWGAVLGWLGIRLAAVSAASTAKAAHLDRRRFLVTVGGASAVVTVSGAAIGLRRSRENGMSASASARTWSSHERLPNAGAAPLPAPGTRPEMTPLAEHYRIDINAIAPRIDESSWRLRLHGLVRRPSELSLDTVRRREAQHLFITLSCISNSVAGSLIGTTRWSGVRLSDLLAEADVDPSATHLLVKSADGFHEVVAIDAVRSDPRIMLAYAWDGLPLAAEHGFPLRLYLPNRYGMKQPKWIEEIEAIDGWRPGYWVARGWSREAQMQATSVIDTVADEATQIGRQPMIPIGGIAHAGARGISRVELRVDDGPWVAAKLREPLSDLTWVLWRYDWPFQQGEHALTVRCTDGEGRVQEATSSPPHPNGATGLHRLMVER